MFFLSQYSKISGSISLSCLLRLLLVMGFPCGSAAKESACNTGDLGLIPGLGAPLGKEFPFQYSDLGEFHGLYSSWGHKESDTTEWFSLGYGSFSDFLCSWWPCQFWGVLFTYFVGWSTFRICVTFPHDLIEFMGFGKEDNRGKVPFSPHTSSTYYQHGFSLVMTLSPDWGGVLSDFFPV